MDVLAFCGCKGMGGIESVTSVATPPAADALRREPLPKLPKMITPSWFQAPVPTGIGESHSVCGGLPDLSTFLS